MKCGSTTCRIYDGTCVGGQILVIIIIIIGFSTVGQENRYKRETGDETVDRLHHLVVQLERKKKKKLSLN